ncbi:MAG: ribbon-helix-helix domain-containing protein [Candidatus Humimicrobiaceae bacterium]
MNTKRRAYIVVPEELVKEIDKLAGKGKRSQFIIKAVRREIQQLKFLKAARETAGAWKNEGHPEFSKGVGDWVEDLRKEDNERLEEKKT